MVNKNNKNNENNKIPPLNTKTNKNTRKESKGIMSSTVSFLSFLGFARQIVLLMFGLGFLGVGIFIRSSDDIPLTLVDAKVSSVTWEDNDGCKSEVVTREKGKKEIQWKCDVVAIYNLGGSEAEEEYKFSNIGSKYIKNQSLTLYRIKNDETMTHVDPNAWKMYGWVAIGIGLVTISSALLWLWICRAKDGQLLCAAKTTHNMVFD